MQEGSISLSAPAPIPENVKPGKRSQAMIMLSYNAYNCAKVKAESPNQFKAIDFQIKDNGFAHNTSSYYLMDPSKVEEPSLVARRGKDVTFVIELERSLHKQIDQFIFVFEWLDPAQTLIGEIIKSPLTLAASFPKEKTPKKWHLICEKISREGQNLQCKMLIPEDCCVGMYKVGVEISYKNELKATFESPTRVFVLFNPWNIADPTFLANNDERKLYLLDDEGLIYKGSIAKPVSYRYNQFSEHVLLAVLRLGTSIGKISVADWDDPVKMALGYSKCVQAPSGIVEANFTGKFDGGTNPAEWTGSAQILNAWLEGNKAVKFGQCFTFATLLTTIFRTLGIPSRTTTCYECGIDVTKSCTVDHFNAEDPIVIKDVVPKVGDSYWNFHMWSEVFIRRSDLGSAAPSWNAVYANEGPCAISAIKEGKLTSNYDTEKFYGEINADVCEWKAYKDKPYILVSTDPKRLGHDISVEGINKKRLDVTDSYKPKDNSNKERGVSVEEARKSIPKLANYTENVPIKEFEFDLKKMQSINLGESFSVILVLTNKAHPSQLKANVTLAVSSVYYTYQAKESIKKLQNTITLAPAASQEIKLEVAFEEYRKKLVDDWYLRCYAFVTVDNPQSEYLDYYAMKVNEPDLKIEVNPPAPKVGDSVKIKLSIMNPLNVEIDGAFILQEIDTRNRVALPPSKIAAKETSSAQFKVTPETNGLYSVKGIFESPDLTSATILRIKIIN